MPLSMNIGEAATATGVSAKMIRHYEKIGLLPEADRTESGYRLYGERELSLLRFVHQSRRMGFSMVQIGNLIGLWGDSHRTSREVKAMAQLHLDDLDQKRREIEQMMTRLSELVESCHGDDTPHCAILERLAQQRLDTHQPKHTPRIKKSTSKTVRPEGGGSQIDLMAWMRCIQSRNN